MNMPKKIVFNYVITSSHFSIITYKFMNKIY